MPTLARGTIVWVQIDDPQGRNPKCRPAVVLTATNEITPDGEVWVAGISTQIGAAPPEECVELPWHRDRHPKTGLTERCEAVCTWLKKVKVSDIQGLAGVVPGAPLLHILSKVGSLPTE